MYEVGNAVESSTISFCLPGVAPSWGQPGQVTGSHSGWRDSQAVSSSRKHKHLGSYFGPVNHHDHWCRIGFRMKVSSAVSFDTAVAYNWLGNTVEANIVSSPYKIRQTPWKWPLTWSVYGERAKMRHSTWFTPWPLIVNSEPQLNTTSESSSILGRHKSPFWFQPIFPLQIVPAGSKLCGFKAWPFTLSPCHRLSIWLRSGLCACR